MDLHDAVDEVAKLLRANAERLDGIERTLSMLVMHLTAPRAPGRPKGSYAKYETFAAEAIELLRAQPKEMRPKRVDSVWLAEALYPELSPLTGRHRIRSMLRKLVAQERIVRNERGRHTVVPRKVTS